MSIKLMRIRQDGSAAAQRALPAEAMPGRANCLTVRLWPWRSGGLAGPATDAAASIMEVAPPRLPDGLGGPRAPRAPRCRSRRLDGDRPCGHDAHSLAPQLPSLLRWPTVHPSAGEPCARLRPGDSTRTGHAVASGAEARPGSAFAVSQSCDLGVDTWTSGPGR